MFSSEVQDIRENEIDIKTPFGMMTIKNDFVFAMTGYQPDYQLLSKIGIDVSGDEIRVPSFNPDTYETNIEGLYLAGVVCGGMETNKWFIENSRDHAEKIFNHIQKK